MKLLQSLIPQYRPGLLTVLIAFVALAAISSQAASDTDVTILKAETVLIESNTVTIVGAARASVTLTTGDYKENYKGDTWHGRPASRITIKADKATFTIKRQYVKPQVLSGVNAEHLKATQETFEKGWQMTVEAAKDLQEGREVGRIGYYAPEIVIRNNLLHSVSGSGYFYRKQ